MKEQLLKDFLETAKVNNYNWDIIMPKFPELKNVELQILKDYVETARVNNYNYDIINPKFPELFGPDSFIETQQPEVKKKGMASPSEDGSLASSETEVVEGAVLSDNTLDKKVDWNATAERESAIINEEQKKESTSGFVSEQAIFGEGGSKADTEVKDPFAATGEMTEKDFFTGTFGDVLRKIDQFSPIDVGDFIDDQARAIASGFKQGELAENASDLLLRGANASDEDIESYLEALRESQKYGASDEFMEFQKIYQKNGEGFLGFVLGIAQTSQSVIPEILLNSFAAMLANKDSRYAFEATVLGGAGIGGASGSAGGPAGIAAGASVGAVGSLPYAFAASGTALEVGATFSELLLEEAGDRELTKEVITEILNDEEAYKRIRNKAIARGLTIGVIDAITGKMGSKFTTGVLTKGGTQSVKQATKKDVLKSIMGSSLIEGAGGSIGEATARALIGQDMDIAEIGLEGIAEVPGSAISFAQTSLSSPTYKVNGEFVDREVINDLISTMTLDEIVQGGIEISNDYSGMEFKLQERIKKLKTEADIILANPNINKPTLDKIAELQLELDKLKGNDTEVAKDKSASIRAEIKNLQENQLEDTVDETTKTSYESLSAEDKMDLRTKALNELEKEGVESPTNEDIDNKAVSILDKELQLLGQESQKKKQSFAEGLGETTDLGDVMEGGVQVNMDGTNVIITEDKDGVTIESIETEEGKKGQGKAEAAVKQITEKADKDGVDVKLKLVPKDNTVDAKRLQALYERNGFKMQEDGVTMVRSIEFDNVSDNLFINRKDSSPILGLIPQKIRSFSMTAARLASKTLSKIAPEVKIVLHESQNEYSKYAKGEGSSSGEYNPVTNTIHINLSNVKRSTVAHEVFHAVLLNKVKNNDALAKKISDDMVRAVQRRLPKNNKLRIAVEEHAAKYQGDQAQFQTEEQIAELIGLLSSVEGGYTQLDSDMKSVIKKFFLNIAKKLNIPLPKNWGSDQDVVDLINTLARKTRTGEAITEEDVKLLDVKEEDKGTNPIGNPTTIIKPKSRQSKIQFKDSYPLSLVSKANKIDIDALIDDVANNNQKVWFWVADQLGLDKEMDIDAGPSFAFQKEGEIWASSFPISKLEKNIKNSDFIFIISGSPTRSHLFNKKVYDKYISKLGDYNTFKEKALETKPTKGISSVLNKYNSWESIKEADGSVRKNFLIAHIAQEKTPNTGYHKLVKSLDGFIDPNSMRDGFYRENDFKQNDIMLVLKPTGVKEGSNHSTYSNTILGDVVGIPDTKIDAFELMPKEMRESMKGATRTTTSQKVAPYGSGIRKVTSKKPTTPATRQQKGIQEARENGEVIETDSELVFFKGMQPKMKNGKPFSVHTIDKGRFAALDKNIALDYKGNKPLKQFKVPKGTTVQVVNVPSDSITKYRKAEEKAINESDAQIVKLITIDARGRSEQYVIKDPALLKTGTDVEEVSAKTQEKQTSRARQQKGLINFTEKDAIKYSKIGVNDARTIQAMENIGLSGVKFTDEGVNKKIKESLNELYSKSDSYLLNEDSNEITRLMNFDISNAENDGYPERVIKQLKEAVNDDSQRKKVIERYRNTQEETLKQWVSHLKQSNYSDAFKYLILDAVLTHNYDIKKIEYKKRTNTTTRNISPFDAGTLAMVYASDSKNLLKSYVEIQQENLQNIINAFEISKTSEGKWLKFDGGPNAENINETATALSQLVQDTYWCTKTNALGQLKGGDFYVYVTDKSPRIAIRMEGDKVGEVRGNASSKQDLEPEMLPVAETFLKENIPNNSGKKWLDSIEFNKKAKEFIERVKNGIGEKEIFEYFNIVSEGEKYNTDYGENGFVTKAKNIFRDKNYYNEDIVDRVAFNRDEFDSSKTEYFMGNMPFRYFDISSLGKLKFIGGNADFENSQVTDLGQLKSIGGSAYFRESQIQSLGQLQSIGGDANFENSQIQSLDQLQSIGSSAYFGKSQVQSLGKLKSIGRDADFGNSPVQSLGQLQSIGRDAYFRNSQVQTLGKLQSIGGNAYFRRSQIQSLGQLQSIGANAYFRNSQVQSLDQLQSIGGSADFGYSQVTDLGQLQSIGANANFENSPVQSLGQLQSIGDDADFEYSQVTDLGQLQSIGGSAYFGKSPVQSLGQLQSIKRDADFRESQVQSLDQLQSIGANAYFRESQVQSLGKLQSIGGIATFGNSQIQSLGQLQSIGGNAYFRESQIQSLGQLQSIGGNADFGNSQVQLKAEWQSRQNKAAIRQSKFDAESFIKNARAQGISEAAIKIILSNRGIDESTINNALSKTKGKASGRVKIDESFAEGYNTMMKVIDGIIKKTKAKFAKEDTSPQTLFDSTLPYLQGSKVYENATDVQREKMVRDLRKKVGLKEKSSPSISRILGKVKDVKNILVSEKELLIKRIKDVREGATTTIKAIKLAQKEIIDGVKDLKKKGKISTTQLTNIISKLNRIDMLSESDVNEFFDYMAKVFNDAEYVEKLSNANNKRNNALKNIPKKIGIANSIAPSLVKIFSINPSLIPDAVFDKYIKLVNQFGERASVLKLSSIKVVESIASEILNQIEIETSKIPQLKEYLESFENKVIDDKTGKLNYAETIRLMLTEEVINESDYEVMKKYKSEIIEKEQKEAKTDAEILKEKKEIIKRLKRRKELNVENLPSRFEVERARRFKELIKDSEILMRLSVNELKQIEKLVGNIRNGYFPSLANEMIIKLEGELNGNKLSKGINEGKLLPKERLKYNLRKLFGKGSKTILNQIKSTPLYYIDQVFGNFKDSLIRNSLFDGLAKQIQQFESSFKKTSGRIEKAQLAVFKSFKNNPNKAVMSSFKQMAYLIQLEYETNIGNPETKHQAKAYIEKTIQAIDDGASTYTDKDAEMLSTILKDFTENGEISLDKIWNSFNSAEKNSIKTIQEVNADLGPIAQQTANIIRGEGITARNNYVHLNVINEKGSDPMANEAFIDGYTKSLKPSTRSKSLIKRQGVVSPLNFDVYASAIKGAKGTLLDFHMTNAIRTANATINSAERLLKGDDPRMSSENRDKFNAIKEAYDNVLRIEFTNAYFTTTFIEDALNWISKNGYRAMLAGAGRAVVEFTSNAAFALLSNPLALISGTKIGIGFINSDAAPEVMNNLNSTQTNRIYPNEDLSGRMIDTNLMNKKKGIKGGKIKNRYANKLTQIWNLTGDKYVNAVATLADNLISAPDKSVMRPVWFGAFQNEFKKITGSNPDFDKIAANDTEYMDANKEALDSATKHADENSIYTGSTTNPFYGILRGKSLPTDTTFKKAYNAFNNFMLTFLMYEYMTVRTGIVSAVGRGSLSKTKGAALVAASATRMIMYTMMISVMGEVMSNLVGGDDEEKEIKSLDKRLGQSIASTLLTASLGRSGNAFRSVINFLAEGANEEYLDMLRDGEYDVYKDGLAFQTIPKEKNRGTGLADILLNSFAAYGPAVKTVDFMVRKATEPAKNTEQAQQRQKEELMYRLPLEVLGNAGFIPMYKDVRKLVLGSIYNGIGNETSDQKNLQKEVKKSFDSGFNNGFNKKGFDKKGFKN